MTGKMLETSVVEELLIKASGLNNSTGDARLKKIVHALLMEMFRIIDQFDIQPNEFWAAAQYMTQLGQANEAGLLIPGLGIEAYLDMRMDAAEQREGIHGGTPRTIEGPLYVPGAPLSDEYARLDDGCEDGEPLLVTGQVRDMAGNPISGAIVDVWHANSLGGYSFFDPSQKPYNLRRRIRASANGDYKFRSVLPSGYACPPNGPTQQLLNRLGRHGKRPAHIHFFVSAEGFRKLTTQINIDGDPYLHDDFAFATRDDLIPQMRRVTDADQVSSNGFDKPFAVIDFDFVLHANHATLPSTDVSREHAKA